MFKTFKKELHKRRKGIFKLLVGTKKMIALFKTSKKFTMLRRWIKDEETIEKSKNGTKRVMFIRCSVSFNGRVAPSRVLTVTSKGNQN